jgi:hypothetical protein
MPELLAALDAFVQEHRRCGQRKGAMESTARTGRRLIVSDGRYGGFADGSPAVEDATRYEDCIADYQRQGYERTPATSGK